MDYIDELNPQEEKTASSTFERGSHRSPSHAEKPTAREAALRDAVMRLEREGRFDVEDMENITMWAQKKSATNVTVAQGASHSTSETIVISETDAAKIRKDAEEAVKKDEKLREQKVFHGSGADFDYFDHSVRFFRTADGKQAYGFTVGGKIYIDPRIATSETPIHKYVHLWAEALRKANPKEWQNVVELMKECKAVWEQVKKEYPELKTDDEIADEVLAHYSGQRGAERLRAEADKATVRYLQNSVQKKKYNCCCYSWQKWSRCRL